jgi:hypothetical protein
LTFAKAFYENRKAASVELAAFIYQPIARPGDCSWFPDP